MPRWPKVAGFVLLALVTGCAPDFDDASNRCAAMGGRDGHRLSPRWVSLLRPESRRPSPTVLNVPQISVCARASDREVDRAS